MDAETGFWIALAALALASYACRVAGYLLMGLLTITPRLEAALRATPLGVMIGIVMPSASSGRLPELAGLVVVCAVMKLTGRDLVAALCGAATVAVCRRLVP
jgi:uncharacterized membrane protein